MDGTDRIVFEYHKKWKQNTQNTHNTYNSVYGEIQVTNIPYLKASTENKIKFGKTLTGCKDPTCHVIPLRGLSGKYPDILNISRTGRLALM